MRGLAKAKESNGSKLSSFDAVIIIPMVIILLIMTLPGGLLGSAAAQSLPGEEWEEQNSGKSNTLLGVTWGDNQFVAVGFAGTILTSPDGVSWTERDSGLSTNNLLQGVTWGDNQFVAVGYNSKILTSPDGVSWTKRDSGLSTDRILSGVTWGDNQFVAVGLEGKILTSPDGVSWTSQSSDISDTSTVLKDVTWDGDKFVAVGGLPAYLGGGAAILTSPDGVNWTRRSLGTEWLSGVTWSGSQFVAVGNRGAIITSLDGINWSDQSSGMDEHLNAIGWSGNQFVAVGREGTILTSPDGVSWTDRSLDTHRSIDDIIWNGSQFVAVGGWGKIFTSSGIVSPSPDPDPDLDPDLRQGPLSIGLYDPVSGFFFLQLEEGVKFVGYGARGAGWIGLSGDWNGDGVYTPGVYDPLDGRFWLKGANPETFTFGGRNSGRIPLAGDWNGDGKYSVGVYDHTEGKFYLRLEGGGIIEERLGARSNNWTPVVVSAGSGAHTVALYDSSDGNFHPYGLAPFRFGPRGSDWTPVTGDWNGDGTYGVGLHYDGHIHLDTGGIVRFGPRGFIDWIPVTGRWMQAETELPDTDQEPDPDPEQGLAIFEAISIVIDPPPVSQINIEPHGFVDYILPGNFTATYTVANTGSQQATQNLVLNNFYSIDFGETNYFEEEYIVESVTINPGETYSYTKDYFILSGDLVTIKLETDDDILEYKLHGGEDIIFDDYEDDFIF